MPNPHAEAKLREELAQCYRLFDWLGWSEGIFNHISLRLPGEPRSYLVNPFGLHYAEVTADNLVRVGLNGVPIDNSPYKTNPAGFVLHAAVHSARDDAHCVIHTHTIPCAAVAQKAAGLSHDSFYGAQLLDRVGYHDFEGITIHGDEMGRMVNSLGGRPLMILRNHGVVAVGSDLPTAFMWLWTLQRACEVQLAAGSIAGPDIALTREVRQRAASDVEAFSKGGLSELGRMLFDAMVRRMEMGPRG